MITYRIWTKRRPLRLGNTYEHTRDGWFLFGIVPLFVRDINVRPASAK